MSILSLTFHCEQGSIPEWKTYFNESIINYYRKTQNLKHYIASEVETERLQEGTNFNLLLIFETVEDRTIFIKNELPNITMEVEKIFGERVLVFATLLNPTSFNL
ncbi:DUF4286 family protein [Riemerella anatipestifer]|uniref:DUF4286 domain-containing protein n=1 Tax=Riemerella anatipestifer (strain ATCC 11845 / DSM 15868 / JCM 9532 / NCTC 11014) TaxID=693978 RepID=E4T908_RIEAD|nr:DUF4286 family protein [Riemerella anatipestifer]ADQ81489.1 hypothetical protein Riean_0319 [Riemerella anatipestifer ATCC 11845 = DSM 15868]AFD55507.1 hypothetical protein RA0C_0530 [Riemerella anatipestifer ATCC 11845 = DSM 15868]AGC40612.1 hypothetical protein G148_1308 [Riemerella anatipestifer RA-CH-2]AKP68764.1 hypothetical protein CG08_0348 [Riemerella anatipestifer]AKP70612.1 hypothetical protein CG09_0334 [Riemerella anatipestifer]